MDQIEDYRETQLQGDFNVFYTKDSCQREEVQHAATITTPNRRPRPGRRRLSMHYLPLCLSRNFLIIIVTLMVLCMPVKAKEKPFPQLQPVQGYFADGMILFDHNAAPQPALHRRDDPVSTDTASTTTAAAVAVMTSSSSTASSSTTSLPRAFDGGFGTNFTQPSCPTFLRSMVSNDTFNSCVPFSLLLQVRQHPPQKKPPPPIPPLPSN